MKNINNYLNYIQEQHDVESTIGVDLDGTLAHYDSWVNAETIGKPIEEMVARIKTWILEGKKVIIFTARAVNPENIQPIKDWLLDNDLPDLEITCIKEPSMKIFYDDRAVQIERNTGRILSQPNLIELE